MPHPALVPGSVPDATGGASGIGFAAAGFRVCVADLGPERLAAAAEALAACAPGGAEDVMATEASVARADRRADAERGRPTRMEPVRAARGLDVDARHETLGRDPWRTDLCPPHDRPGPARGGHRHRGEAGIPTPRGDPAYNTSKAGAKVLCKALAHERRQTPDHRLIAHLHSRLRLRRADPGRPEGKAGRGEDGGADGGFHARGAEGGELLHSLSRRRRGPAPGGASHPLGRRRRRGDQAGALWHPDPAGAFAAFIRRG